MEEYFNFLSFFSPNGQIIVNSLILIFLLLIICLFIWVFYKSISKRDLIELNLRKYNYSQHPVFKKVFASFLYFVEYLLIIPFLIFLWYSGLSIILFILSADRTINDVLLISTGIIGSVRILAYFKKEISEELAKLFPFIALSVFLLSPNALNVSRVISQFSDIPLLFTKIIYFMFSIFIVEIFLRFNYAILMFFKSEEERSETKNI